MPNIKSSSDLLNNYNEISTLCHSTGEPIFITKDGQDDLAVMSVETYNVLCGINELRGLLAESRADIAAGRTRPHKDVMTDLRKKYASV